VVSVAAGPEAFAALFAAAEAAGVRLGWLEWRAPAGGDGALETATGFGALRAVAVGDGRVQSAKRLRGEPVLRDLLREHFLGCAVVLLHGLDALPRLAPSGTGGFRLETTGGRALELDPAAAVAELARPRHRA
jgi:hypothetical protein